MSHEYTLIAKMIGLPYLAGCKRTAVIRFLVGFQSGKIESSALVSLILRVCFNITKSSSQSTYAFHMPSPII